MDVENRSLRYAVTLAQYGNFARAAKALHLSQPALSRAIQSLEATLGARLFDRHAKGVRATAVGEEFVARARSILGEVDDLLRISRDLSRGVIGRIDVGAGPFQSRLLVEPALHALLCDRARLDVQLRVRSPRALLEALRAEEIDVFVAANEVALGQPDLEQIPLGEQPLVLFVRPGHPLLRDAPVTWAQVFAHPVAVSAGPEIRTSWVRSERCRAENAAGLVLADDVGLLRNLVEAGDAVGCEPLAMAAPEITSGRFAALALDGVLPPLAPAVVWHRDRPLSPPAQALVSAIVEIDRKLAEQAVSARGRDFA
jgi:DNA-binding transcriptional LysR family regulator